MTEMYFITRLNELNNMGVIALIFGILGFIIFIICYCIKKGEMTYDENSSTVATCNALIKISKYTIYAGLIGALIVCFVPTTKEALVIYGVGGTIDYVQTNDKAKQIPDKTIDALNRYLDSIEDNNKDSINTKINNENISK